MATKMLTSIQEVDLGKDSKLRNIRETGYAVSRIAKSESNGSYTGSHTRDGAHAPGTDEGLDMHSRGVDSASSRKKYGGHSDRSNKATDDIVLERFKKLRNNEAAVEDQLNARVSAEVEQLLMSFGEIIQSSRIYNSNPIDLTGKKAKQSKHSTQNQQQQQQQSRHSDGESDGYDDLDDESVKASKENTKDKYAVAQEAYGAQTRAATMVRSVEKLLAMVADVRRARLVNDATALVTAADARRKVLDERTQATRNAVAELNTA
ncbi:hypothetical protein LPJ53_006630, partial [Coemansia erecta]